MRTGLASRPDSVRVIKHDFGSSGLGFDFQEAGPTDAEETSPPGRR